MRRPRNYRGADVRLRPLHDGRRAPLRTPGTAHSQVFRSRLGNKMLTQIRIGDKMSAYLGKPAGTGSRPVVIHLHERYGIVKHTLDLAQKIVDAGYVVLVPDLYWRFTGDREALARGEARAELSDTDATMWLQRSFFMEL